MKRLLPLVVSCFLCHCGTEVGNGVAPSGGGEPEASGTATATNGTTNDSYMPESAKSSIPTSAGSSAPVLSASLIAACASPFAETVTGTFLKNGMPAFTVTQLAGGKKTVSRPDGSLLYVITPTPTASTYAIEALPNSPDVGCSGVSSQTLADGSIQRSVTLSNSSVVRWTVSGGQVTSMKVTTTTPQSEEIWTQQ